MSNVIEEYIRKHPGLRESEAFESFVTQERIQQWVGADLSRKERLRSEFGRVWEQLQGAAGGTRGPVTMRETDREIAERVKAQHEKRVQVQVNAEPMIAPKKLQLLCSVCTRMDVWRTGGIIQCRNCGRQFDDMLELVPVQPVGPFAFLFGDGIVGIATAAGIALLLLALYGVLRWV